MNSSALTVKGQVTIPVDIRNQLGLHPGDKIGFIIEDDHVFLFRKESNIVGSTICYAYMQAVGMVNDHTANCFCYRKK